MAFISGNPYREIYRSLVMRSLAIVFLTLAWLPAHAEEPDWMIFDQILAKYVASGDKEGLTVNLVDYEGLSRDPGFAVVVEQVRNFDVKKLSTENEKLAFYINAYNILTIQLILDNWPTKSIRDIGGFFKGPWDYVMLVNGDGKLTLDDIEHKIIRPFGDPRIHFAVNCASLSCPDLPTEAFKAKTVREQLEKGALKFFQHKGKGARLDGETLRVTKLLEWYGEDFDAGGGIEVFLKKYVPNVKFEDVETDIDYSWVLNAQ
jgi:hypothetical protein